MPLGNPEKLYFRWALALVVPLEVPCNVTSVPTPDAEGVMVPEIEKVLAWADRHSAATRSDAVMTCFIGWHLQRNSADVEVRRQVEAFHLRRDECVEQNQQFISVLLSISEPESAGRFYLIASHGERVYSNSFESCTETFYSNVVHRILK